MVNFSQTIGTFIDISFLSKLELPPDQIPHGLMLYIIVYICAVIKLLKSILCQNSYCNTIGQSSFISFITCTARPLLKLKFSVLLVMYNWLNGFYCVMNDKYNISLAVTHDALHY